MAEASSSTSVKTTVSNAKFEVEKFDGCNNFSMWQCEVFSPVVKHSSIRILLALVAQFDLELVQLDVKTAFLHDDLEEKIYMSQPDGFKVAEKEN